MKNKFSELFTPPFLIVIGLLVLALFIATPMIIRIPWPGYSVLKPLREIGQPTENASVEHLLLSPNIKEDLLKTVQFTGFAIPELNGEYLKQDDIVLILKPVSGTPLVVQSVVQDRFDPIKRQLVAQGIGEVKHGFTVRFSSIGMNQGNYSIILGCLFENQLLGIVDTNYDLSKTKNGIEFIGAQ